MIHVITFLSGLQCTSSNNIFYYLLFRYIYKKKMYINRIIDVTELWYWNYTKFNISIKKIFTLVEGYLLSVTM